VNFWQRDASYSHHYAEVVNGHRKVLLNEVVVGEWMKGNQALSGPYPKVVGSKNRYSSQLCIITKFTM